MKTALVLGGAGFLGRHLIPKLLERECQVTAVDPGFSNYGAFPTVYDATWMCFEDWMEDGNEETYDFVFHLAANLTKHNIDERNKMGIGAFADIELDRRVAQYLEAYPPRERAVWLSSSATDTFQTDPYSFVKFVGERFASTLAKHGVPISILKPFGGFGPGQSLNYPMPAIISRAINRQEPLTVWGGLGTQRDWIFVSDLIDAIMLATTHDFPVGVPIEIGTGIATTFRDLAWIIAQAVGYKPQIIADVSKPTASLCRVANTEAAEALGFKAKVSLEEGIKRCLAYALEHREIPAV